VNFYRNTDRPHPLTSGNIDTEISTAAAAWTNPTTASLILAYGGTRSAGGATDVFCTSVNSGSGLVSFEDPEEDAGRWRARHRRLLRQRTNDDRQRSELLEHLERLRGLQPGGVDERLLQGRPELSRAC
jgi:hypothetical protein